jgi:hypothetical protein
MINVSHIPITEEVAVAKKIAQLMKKLPFYCKVRVIKTDPHTVKFTQEVVPKWRSR